MLAHFRFYFYVPLTPEVFVQLTQLSNLPSGMWLMGCLVLFSHFLRKWAGWRDYILSGTDSGEDNFKFFISREACSLMETIQ